MRDKEVERDKEKWGNIILISGGVFLSQYFQVTSKKERRCTRERKTPEIAKEH